MPRPPRTLVDVLHATAAIHPDEAALDDGTVLSYARLVREVDALAARLVHAGVGRGHRVGVRMASGRQRALRRDPRRAPRAEPPTCRSTPTIPRTGPTWCSARRAWRSCSPTAPRSTSRTGPRAPSGPRARRRRLDHLHVRIHRCPQGRRRDPSGRRGVRRRGGRAVRARRAARTRGSRAGRALGGVRRLLRGDVAGVAARRVPRARPSCAGAHGHGPRAVAGGPGHHRRVHGAHPRRPVAGRLARPGAPPHLRRRGLPGQPGRAGRGAGARGVEHLRTDGGDRRRLRRTAGRPTGRCASGCRSPDGTWPSWTPAACRCPPARSAS